MTKCEDCLKYSKKPYRARLKAQEAAKMSGGVWPDSHMSRGDEKFQDRSKSPRPNKEKGHPPKKDPMQEALSKAAQTYQSRGSKVKVKVPSKLPIQLPIRDSTHPRASPQQETTSWG